MGNKRIGNPDAGRWTLFLAMVVLALGLLGAAGTSVALADTDFAGQPAEATPTPPLTLPDEPEASSTASSDDPSCESCRRWIVGGQPGKRGRSIATKHGARIVDARLGLFSIDRDDAARFAHSLKKAGLLVFAEPDRPTQAAGYPEDFFSDKQSWLKQIVNPADVTPPAATESSPVIGLIEKGIDPNHPDLKQANLADATPTGDLSLDSHGTSIAGIIGSPAEGNGIRGVWPGARMRHFPAGGTCVTAASAVINAVRAGVSVLNMSYTMVSCYTHYLATQYAVSRGVLPVAAAGNDYRAGNPVLYPAADPHVISVGAVDSSTLEVAPFSTANRFVDLSAPGVGVFAPVIRAGSSSSDSTEPVKVGYVWKAVDGTSFATPMVSAAAAWLRQIHPNLSASQATRILIGSSRDLGTPGRDPFYGAGLLDIDAALMAKLPPKDRYEPNDDIPLLKGAGWIPRIKPLWRANGPRVVRFTSSLSRSKDPADVYPIKIPAKTRILVTAEQLEGDVKVLALKPATKSLLKRKKKVIVRSDKVAPKTEGIGVRNLRKKPQTIWLAITPSKRYSDDYSTYRLTIRRAR